MDASSKYWEVRINYSSGYILRETEKKRNGSSECIDFWASWIEGKRWRCLPRYCILWRTKTQICTSRLGAWTGCFRSSTGAISSPAGESAAATTRDCLQVFLSYPTQWSIKATSVSSSIAFYIRSLRKWLFMIVVFNDHAEVQLLNIAIFPPLVKLVNCLVI